MLNRDETLETRREAGKKTEKVFTWPNLVAKEFLAAILVTVFFLVYAFYIDAPLRELANPGEPENPAKAPWYFLGLQEELVYFDPWFAGVVLPGIIIVGLMMIPYLDVNPKGIGVYNFSDRKFAVTVFVFGFTFWFVLIIIGVYMRGPFWTFFWPWEEWNFDFPTPPPLKSFPNILGAFALIVYFGLGLIIPAILKRDFYKKLGFIRYNIVMIMLFIMIGIIIKMFLRLQFNIKYVLQTPWFNI
ncbi:MAG: putative bc1 protein (putative UQ:cyt c oxidoreductase) [Candidatus Scalindua rubra]|uniref:Putative bc1 protein (Putative UQ:cyt c oxidoreductase) n=1 Tax=Candidatus Scalindua rubra TaxID=1872076 RepID=A0A1E3XGL9_9BACT|nr:MAG: putative bc1 protein (putative UQ:cyt c oxidoreductase) [Candidatus Scalindua rubra]